MMLIAVAMKELTSEREVGTIRVLPALARLPDFFDVLLGNPKLDGVETSGNLNGFGHAADSFGGGDGGNRLPLALGSDGRVKHRL